MATSRRDPLALPLSLLTLLGLAGWCGAQTRYQGREIGALSQLHHGVRGRVFAVDSRTIHIQDLHYDGEGPAAYFYVGKSKAPSASGARRLRDERGGAGALRRYRGEGVTLALPDGLALSDVRWFAIWCDEYAVNFGDVRIPRDLQFPKPAKVGALRGVHGVASDPVVVVDAQTLLVPHFSYDGEAPDAKFWVGRGESPSPQGIRIPDENGKEEPLRKYDRKTIVLTLPGELTVFDIGHFGVWCEAFTVDFGHVPLPRAALRNVPPSLKMLGVSPQSRNTMLLGATEAPSPRAPARPRAPAPAPGARLDATTYRPHLRPGTGPLQALLDQPADQPADHSALHRRADTYTPPQHQLLQDPDEKDQQDMQAPTEHTQQDDDQNESSKEQQKTPLAIDQITSRVSHERQMGDPQYEVRPTQADYTAQQALEQQRQQIQQQALEQQRQQELAESQPNQPQQRVEVQEPELLELQYYRSEPEYNPQHEYFAQQERRVDQELQQRRYDQELQQLQQLQLQQFRQLQQLQQLQQQADPYRYRLVPYDRGFAH